MNVLWKKSNEMNQIVETLDKLVDYYDTTNY